MVEEVGVLTLLLVLIAGDAGETGEEVGRGLRP